MIHDKLLAEVFNFSDTKFVPTSEIVVMGSTYYEKKTVLHILIRLSVLKLFTGSIMGNLLH